MRLAQMLMELMQDGKTISLTMERGNIFYGSIDEVGEDYICMKTMDGIFCIPLRSIAQIKIEKP